MTIKTIKSIIIIGLFFSKGIYLQAQIIESKTFIDALSKKDYTTPYNMFDTIVSKKISQEQLPSIWETIQNQVGDYKSYSSITQEKEEEHEVVYVTCKFERMTLDLKLVYNNNHKIVGFFFVPPHPKETAKYQLPVYDKEFDYTEQDITVKTGEYSLPGILTLPKNKKNIPILILVHGSGPQDRGETIGPNKIFRDLAVGFATNGIATLRYDKRTKVYAEKLSKTQDSITVKEETIDDVISAIKLASTFNEIDKSKIYILGHSLGGMLAPEIAFESKEVKGIVMMAANARPLEDLILEQVNYILSLGDSITTSETKQLEIVSQQVAKVKSNELTVKTPSSELPFNVPASYWIALKKYNQLETAKKIKSKILILQGERDYQVTMTDFNLWKKELSDHKNVSFKSYPKLNHLFIEEEGKSKPEEYEHPGNVAEYVIIDIAEWIKKN